MNRQEAEKIKDELIKAYKSGQYSLQTTILNYNFENWFNNQYPPEPEYIPFEYTDFNDLKGEEVRRKGEAFKNDIYIIVGVIMSNILGLVEKEENIISTPNAICWKLFSTMFEEWEFADGKPFGKLKK